MSDAWSSYGGEIVSYPWFTREEYERVRQAIIDPHNLPLDFDAFAKLIETFEYQAEYRGTKSCRVQIDLQSMRAWCVRERIEVSAQACYLYANYLAIRHLRDDS